MHAFNPSTWETEAEISEFKANLVYRQSFKEKSYLKKLKRTKAKQNKNKQTNELTYSGRRI